MIERRRRVVIAICASTAMVVVMATLLPRAYLVNDDPGFVLYLRLGSYTAWISPVLNRALVAAYEAAPGVPWYGLYLYALIVATGAVLIHSCLELIDRRPGSGRVATWLGAILLIASHLILVLGITWTTISIASLGTALVAWVAHLQACQAAGVPASRVRALVYGLLFVAGYALRQAAILAMLAALLPLLGWVGLQFLRRRHLPRPTAVLAFLAPFAIVFAIEDRIPQSPGGEPQYEEFNQVRGRISEASAFGNLHIRAPELLERAGWTVEEYFDFANWLLADDTEFTLEKVRRLADTGGVPTAIGMRENLAVLHGIAVHSAASVWLFLSIVAGALLLAWIGAIDRRRALWFSLGTLVFLMIVPVLMASVSRFPQRIALSFYTIAAFGMFVLIAHELASRPPLVDTARRGTAALSVIALFGLVWARHLIAWTTEREAWPYHDTLRAFAERVNARNGIIMVAVGITEMDPLLADPRGYDALPSGWGTFTYPWYEYIGRFGIRSGAELLRTMIDNPNAYVVATPYGHETFEEWIGRRVGVANVRMALVDSAAGMPAALRSELYRLVTTPLVSGSEEWKLLARNYAALDDELPGPPDVSDRAFSRLAFGEAYNHLSAARRQAPGITVTRVEGGIRCLVARAEPDPCADRERDIQPSARRVARVVDGGEHAGVQVAVDGLGAARFHLTLIDPENILSVYVYATSDTGRSIRWRWELDDGSRRFGFAGTVTLVPGYPARRLELVEDTADPADIRRLHVFVAVVPGTRAGFELRQLEVAAP